jgi:hypothetical protein
VGRWLEALPNIDGRLAPAKRFKALCLAFEAELGGQLSEADAALVQQAAGLALRAEQLNAAIVRGESVASDELVRIASTSKRLLEAIRGKVDKRKATGPTPLQKYLAKKAGTAE